MEGDPAASRAASAAPSRGWLYFLLAAMLLFWSGNFIVGKYAVRQLPGTLAAVLRIELAAAFVLPLFWWQRRQGGARWPARREWPRLLAVGVLGIAGNQMLFIVGLEYTSVAHAAFLVTLNPILVLVLARLVGGEKLTPRRVAGMLVAASGVLMLQFWPERAAAAAKAASFTGDALIFCSGLLFAGFAVWGKPITRHQAAVTITASAYVGATVLLLPATLWIWRGFAWSAISVSAWLSVLYMAIFPSVLAYLIFSYALRHTSASRLAALAYLQPPLATLLAAITLGERLTLPVLASGAVICAGVYLAERS